MCRPRKDCRIPANILPPDMRATMKGEAGKHQHLIGSVVHDRTLLDRIFHANEQAAAARTQS
eukprot:CAMPEP_0114129672 /NCGR_PEP_ID=MMETSP0043_2-20121206/11600_1 /TAXON_ID=464988 /ORGANISM="Hemiselmis andersenii, Strain CCMP644" /LENGTH=61 /DNA_ID=CAMNT_0001222963 /DNA_START=87 /DNA_END=272 /DNA_ORIENTATION=-